MKWYQKIFKRNNDKTRQSYFDSSSDWFYGDVSSSGVNNPNTAMRIATAYRCVDILSTSIAGMPLLVKQKRNGIYAVDESNELNYLLQIRANSRLSAFDMLQNAVIQMVNYGNAYILPKYGKGGVESLILFSPNTTTYDVNTDQYHVNDFINDINETFTSDEIIHLKNMSLDGGYSGVSTIHYASRVLGITQSADKKTLDSFQPGATLKGFISGDGDAELRGLGALDEKQIKTIADSVNKQIKSGRDIFGVPGQARFNQLSMSSTDLQLLETRKFGVLDICRFYGVHPDKVFAGQSQNYKASAMSNESFLADTLQGRLRKIENEFTAKLIPRNLAGTMKIEFDIESLLMMSLESQANYMEKTIQCGVYSPNDWRARKGQSPIDGGDELFMSTQVSPININKKQENK